MVFWIRICIILNILPQMALVLQAWISVEFHNSHTLDSTKITNLKWMGNWTGLRTISPLVMNLISITWNVCRVLLDYGSIKNLPSRILCRASIQEANLVLLSVTRVIFSSCISSAKNNLWCIYAGTVVALEHRSHILESGMSRTYIKPYTGMFSPKVEILVYNAMEITMCQTLIGLIIVNFIILLYIHSIGTFKPQSPCNPSLDQSSFK